MKIQPFIMAAVLAASGLAFTGCANEPAKPTSHSTIERKSVDGLPTVTATESMTAEVKIEAVDYDNRSIALAGADGKTEIFTVSPMVRNFPQLKKGDIVKVEYHTTMVATVHKVSEAPRTELATLVMPAELGQKPGVLCMREARIEANVEAINYETRAVRLKTASGSIIKLTADKKLMDFDKVHVGDQVIFNYTETLVIDVK